MRNIFVKTLLVIVLGCSVIACKKDDSCSASFPVAGAFVNDWGQSVTVAFTTENVKDASISSTTGGWTATADLATHTVTVTAPESADAEDAATTSTITLSVGSPGGTRTTATLYAYIIGPTVDLSADGTSNCYVLTEPNTKYRFNASVKGETGDRLAVADVGIVWQSSTTLLRYLTFNKDGYAEFYIGYDEDNSQIRNGNALVAAYNDAGDIIWSWHLWITKTDPRTEDIATYSNGMTFMGRNLGAYSNSNESTEAADILASYGLYYQWGRKDPFFRPYSYNCGNNGDETVYNVNGRTVYQWNEEADATTGTIAYTIAHPTTYIHSTGKNRGDWLWSANNSLWGENGGKTLYDPCPRGWRVPSKGAFSVLDIAEDEDNMDLEQAKKIFGWNLTDKGSGEKYFYLGGGYRSYFDGVLSNVNYKDQYPYTPVPWVGYYWTAGSDGSNASAMFFDLNTTRATINAFNAESTQYRGNAMQVRCVKAE